jgi:hypothetical protein
MRTLAPVTYAVGFIGGYGHGREVDAGPLRVDDWGPSVPPSAAGVWRVKNRANAVARTAKTIITRKE